MGRKAKPISLHLAEGNKNRLTKSDIQQRKNFESSLKSNTKFREEPETKNDPVAHKEFLRLRKLFKELDYIDGLDQAIINRYCQLKSQEDALHKMYLKVSQDLLEIDDANEVEKKMKKITPILTKQTQLRSMILKLEDRLFLTPTSRIQSVLKKSKEKQDTSPMAKFLEKKNLKRNS